MPRKEQNKARPNIKNNSVVTSAAQLQYVSL